MFFFGFSSRLVEFLELWMHSRGDDLPIVTGCGRMQEDVAVAILSQIIHRLNDRRARHDMNFVDGKSGSDPKRKVALWIGTDKDKQASRKLLLGGQRFSGGCDLLRKRDLFGCWRINICRGSRNRIGRARHLSLRCFSAVRLGPTGSPAGRWLGTGKGCLSNSVRRVSVSPGPGDQQQSQACCNYHYRCAFATGLLAYPSSFASALIAVLLTGSLWIDAGSGLLGTLEQ